MSSDPCRAACLAHKADLAAQLRVSARFQKRRPSAKGYDNSDSSPRYDRQAAPANPASVRPNAPSTTGVQKPSIVRARAALAAPAARNEVFEAFPLVVPKGVAVHRCSPKNSFESDLRPLGNPKTLNRHYGLGVQKGSRLAHEKRVVLKESPMARVGIQNELCIAHSLEHRIRVASWQHGVVAAAYQKAGLLDRS